MRLAAGLLCFAILPSAAQQTSAALQAPPAPYKLLHSGAECNSDDQNLGDQSSAQDCANACNEAGGCRYFIFGTGRKTGRCYFEKTLTAACTEGWEEDLYDFYQLEGTQGCTDPRAPNYNADVRFDDGSCQGMSGCFCKSGDPNEEACRSSGPCPSCSTCKPGTNEGYRSAEFDQLQAPLVNKQDIQLDGDLHDWRELGIAFHTDVPFATEDGNLVVFQNMPGDKGSAYFGPSDFSVSFAVAWRDDAFLMAVEVTDDVFTVATTCYANGLQLAFEVGGPNTAAPGMLQALRSDKLELSMLDLINAGLTAIDTPGNVRYPAFCSSLGDTAAGQNYPVGSADFVDQCCVHYEKNNAGGFKKDSHIAVSRNKLSKKTTYEVAISLRDLIGPSAVDSPHKAEWKEGLVFGFSMLVNDGDDRAWQQGWGGYYPHAIVMGWNGGEKEAAKAGTVRLAGSAALTPHPGCPTALLFEPDQHALGTGGGGDGGAGMFFGGFFLAVGLVVALVVARHGYSQGWFLRWGVGKRVVTTPSGMSASPLASADHCQSSGLSSAPQGGGDLMFTPSLTPTLTPA